MGYVLNFLVIAIIVLWVMRLLVRMIFPSVIRNVFSKMQNPGAAQQKRAEKPEGSISIDYMPQKEKKQGNTDSLGEFVDYEELK